MFLMISISIYFLTAINIFSPENIISVIVGTIGTFGLTQWLKNQGRGLQGFGAMLLAVGISFAVAIFALIGSILLNGGGFSWEKIISSGIQIFAFATIAYKAIYADKK